MHCRCHYPCQYAVTTLSLSTVTVTVHCHCHTILPSYHHHCTPLSTVHCPLSTVHCPLSTVAFTITVTMQSLSCHCHCHTNVFHHQYCTPLSLLAPNCTVHCCCHYPCCCAVTVHCHSHITAPPTVPGAPHCYSWLSPLLSAGHCRRHYQLNKRYIGMGQRRCIAITVNNRKCPPPRGVTLNPTWLQHFTFPSKDVKCNSWNGHKISQRLQQNVTAIGFHITSQRLCPMLGLPSR